MYSAVVCRRETKEEIVQNKGMKSTVMTRSYYSLYSPELMYKIEI